MQAEPEASVASDEVAGTTASQQQSGGTQSGSSPPGGTAPGGGATDVTGPSDVIFSPEIRRIVLCQVPGCGQEVQELKNYYRRYRICPDCVLEPAIMIERVHQRFCQACGRFHELAAFDEEKRSCRRKLKRHNERRQKRPGTKPGRGPAAVQLPRKPAAAASPRQASQRALRLAAAATAAAPPPSPAVMDTPQRRRRAAAARYAAPPSPASAGGRRSASPQHSGAALPAAPPPLPQLQPQLQPQVTAPPLALDCAVPYPALQQEPVPVGVAGPVSPLQRWQAQRVDSLQEPFPLLPGEPVGALQPSPSGGPPGGRRGACSVPSLRADLSEPLSSDMVDPDSPSCWDDLFGGPAAAAVDPVAESEAWEDTLGLLRIFEQPQLADLPPLPRGVQGSGPLALALSALHHPGEPLADSASCDFAAGGHSFSCGPGAYSSSSSWTQAAALPGLEAQGSVAMPGAGLAPHQQSAMARILSQQQAVALPEASSCSPPFPQQLDSNAGDSSHDMFLL